MGPTLTWAPATDPDDPVAGYRVYRDGKQVGKTTTTAFTDSRLAKPNATGFRPEQLPTVRDVFEVLLLTHPSLHVGQLSVWRRLTGLPPGAKPQE